jgi:hypothetical protein
VSTREDYTLFTLLVFFRGTRLFIPDQPPNETHRILFLFLASLFCIYSLVCAVLLVQSEFGLDKYHPRLLDTPPICVKRGRAFRFSSYHGSNFIHVCVSPPLYLEKKCRQAYGTPFPTFRMEGPPPGGCFNLLFRRMSRGCRFLIACRRRSTLLLGSGRFYEIVNCEFYIPYMVL